MTPTVVDKSMNEKKNVVTPPSDRSETLQEEIKQLKLKLINYLNIIKALKGEMASLKMEKLELVQTIEDLKLDLDISKLNEVSPYHTKLTKTFHSIVMKEREKYLTLKKHFQRAKFHSDKVENKLSRRILGETMVLHPSISFETASQIISIARAQLLEEIGLVDGKDITFDDIVDTSPSDKVLRDMIDDTAAEDVLFLIHKRVFHEDIIDGKQPAVFLSCDKGTSGGFVKIISWYSKGSQKVEQKILDVDKSYGDSYECAKAM